MRWQVIVVQKLEKPDAACEVQYFFTAPFSSSTNGCLLRRSYSHCSHSAPEQCLLDASHSHSRLFKGVELTFRLFPIDSFDVANSRVGFSKLAYLLVAGDSKNVVRSRKCVSIVEILKARRVVCPNRAQIIHRSHFLTESSILISAREVDEGE